jgi:hypothetical protein
MKISKNASALFGFLVAFVHAEEVADQSFVRDIDIVEKGT